MEYQRAFTELGKYAPEAWSVEANRTQDFIHSLRPVIRERLSLFLISAFQDATERAALAERDIKDARA